METNKNLDGTRSYEKIDLLAIAKTIWIKRRIIALVVFLFILLGVCFAILTPREYTANSIFIPQTAESGKTVGGFGDLATLAGINLSGAAASMEIPPTLYPKLASSASFKLKMLETPITIGEAKTETTYQAYYEEYYKPGLLSQIKKYTIGLPGVIIGIFRSPQSEVVSEEGDEEVILTLTPAQVAHFKRLDSQVSIAFNAKEGFVQLSVTMPEPLAAAQMAKYAEELLQKAVIDYRIQNAREQLKFTEERYQEKKEEFEAIQGRLANFRDRNQNISSAVALNRIQQLEAEYNLAFSVYTELAKQVEQSKLRVSKDTPIFSVIQPVTVPSEKSSPNLRLILIVFTMLGIVLALGIVFILQFITNIRGQWDETTV
jgi:LPS O-antigen subunit length determinant protein (WzzB/FepE family)